MILAEKIMNLRKQNGWSQEELASRLDISRQSVSKWESGASVPELDKIVRLSEIFGVSTDYLLRESEETIPDVIFAQESCSETQETRRVDMAEAAAYLDTVQNSAKKMAAGVAVCVLSPVPLIVLGGMSEEKVISITENMAGAIGLTILLLVIAAATACFIMTGMNMEKYKYLETDALSLSNDTAEMAAAKKEEFEPVYRKCVVAGVTLCIISAVPLMVASAFDVEILYIYCVGILLAMVSCGTFLFVWSGTVWGSFQKLLEEGDYTREKKFSDKKNGNLKTVYWCTVTAIYLGVSFLTKRWDISWIIWVLAGVLFAAVLGIAAMMRNSSNKEE